MTREEFDKFLTERPLLTLSGLSKEGGKRRNALQQDLPLSGEIKEKILVWLLPLLEKYGLTSQPQ